MTEDRGFRMLHWGADEAQLKGFTSSNRGKATTIKIELEVVDPDRLGMIMTQLQEAAKPFKPPAPPKAEMQPALPAPRRALPAPLLQLEDRSSR